MRDKSENIPRSGISCIRPDVEVVLLIGDEVNPPEVHGLVAAVEADVAFLGLARVSRRTDDQPLDIGQDSLVLGVGVGHGDPVSVLRVRD